MSIFQEYYSEQHLYDRYLTDSDKAIDVIIPVLHTNELWRANLVSIYREIPVRNLLISNGGVIDDSLTVLADFPRVKVLDHSAYKTLGKCIAELIKNVEADWFAYLHSDVYLPKGWFDAMYGYRDRYDWYGCPMNITALINYRLDEPGRPYAGSQIGRKEALMNGIGRIDDDFVYRQEDFVFNRIVEDAGYKTGKVEDTFHYHQLMYRKSTGYDLNVIKVNVQTKTNEKEVLKAIDTQVRGIVKYLDPVEPFVIADFQAHAISMLQKHLISYRSFRNWISMQNPKWLAYFNYRLLIKLYLMQLAGLGKTVAKKLVK